MKKFKHIEVYKNELEYPAAEEIASLRRKILPGNLSYLYESSSCDPGVGDCVKYGEETLMLRVWRPMDASDVAQYAERAAAYNTDVVKTRKGCGKDCAIGASPAKSLQLLARAAGPNWPNDLVILTGRHTVQSKAEEGGCLGMGRDFWSFAALTRDIYVDFMLVENASPRPVTIDAMIGMYHKSPELRAVSSEGSTGENIPIVVDQLAAGQRMLIPMRIVLATDNYTHGLFDDYKVSMEQIHRVLGGATGYAKAVKSYNRTPKFKDYSYGPTLSIDGLVVNGTKLSMAKRRSSNSIDLSTVAEIGSCPYLLSWDEKGREWVEHGKVLHKAPAKDKSYTEARDFEGLRTRFRIEEREPEIAHIDAAALILTFDGGGTLRLAPAMNDAQASLRLEADLAWGEQLDLNFRLPEGSGAGSIAKSQLEITGYYERYSNLASGVEQPRLPSAITP